MWLAALVNLFAVLLNIFIGVNFGFTPVTVFCIALSTGVAAFCATVAFLDSY